jgi:hypothetical protein
MSWKTCAAAVRQAAGRDLTDDQVEDIFERAQLKQRALEAAGQIDGLDKRLREAVAADADALRIEAALARKHAALSVIARDRAVAHVEKLLPFMKPLLIGNRYRDAVLALFEGTTKGIEGARRSISATKLAYEGRFVGGMMARVVREVPHAEGMLRDRAFLDDVVREMARPGSTRNSDAAKVGRIFADAAEESRLELNRLGANIGKLDGWAGTQIHDADKIGRVAPEAWIDAVLPRLDLARTFPDLDEAGARRALGKVWENIVFERERGDSPDPAGSGYRGPVNVARALERHRVLHFKSADDWLGYSDQFGSGHIFDGMIQHQSRAALNAAQMEILGPNPGATLESVLDVLRRRVDVDDAIPPDQKKAVKDTLHPRKTAIAGAFDIASGASMIPVHRTMANIGSGIRAWQSLSKLGGAVISSVTDLPVAIVNLRFNGMTFGEAAGGQVREFLKGRGRAEQREIAYLLGEGFDGVIGHLTSPYVANDGAPGAMQSMLSTFFRWTGLSLWTDANRAGVARVLSAHLGRQAGREFGALDARLQNVLRQHDIDAATWDVIRTEGLRRVDGRPYVVPGEIQDRAADLALRRYFADEAASSVLEADAATQRFTTWGGQSRGTAVGEIARFIMQFKAFPVAFTQRVLGRAVQGGPEGTTAGAAHIGSLIVGLTLLGYAAMTAKDAIRGYEPREVLDDNGNPRMATILAALVQGGGAGIYGDFLFGEVSRTGNRAADTALGPAFGDIFKVINLLQRARDGDAGGADALTAALGSTPFANVFYARPVLDYLILNELRESLNPGFLARQDQRRREQFGQDPLIAPSDRMALDLF